ncbi:hypothetical protein SODALDRAFT_352419 [Sodiomyces alkalinus F11]|uniref:Zn(2)-C6 fungal-type domain-containing protein n=1 Tax=Sodiomyces alkalinus (strain CBS 110278 / VKM F-3762 / F11) TaxID=1314773 RepID=A0A3N2PPK7_SODAK|nr:hypothetical protein SODALDRAFT_352419 [Sodiomyces alkalinus F11]ROT36442.1 hypothetical protein SODALDRAFT_352419 [Sodiomyces alkalinus F11]
MTKMYPMSDVDGGIAGMPLRQTCDRCRYLKVRCEKDSGSPSVRCVRCSKAGALCIRNPRQRSGRPLSNNSLHTGSRDLRSNSSSNSSSSLSLDFCNDGPSQKWPSRTAAVCADTTLRSSLEPSNDLSWLNARSITSFQAIEQFMEYGEDTNNVPSFDPDMALEHGLEFLADGSHGTMLDQSPGPESSSSSTRDAMETDIRELTELSLRAHRITTDAGTPSTDELFAMTQSALKVLARITSTVQQQQQQQQQPNEVSAVPGNGDQDPQPAVQHGPWMAISLVLQAVSVCEQIYEMFGHACSVLQSELEPDVQHGSGSGSGSDANDHRMSDARAVMTVELINYLFEKLSRAQRQLLAAALTADDASANSLDDMTPEDSITSLSVPSDALSRCSTSVIPILRDRAHGKHPQLQKCIQAIRDLTRNKDCI